MNLNPYIQEQIDATLKYKGTVDHKAVAGFIITDEDIGIPTAFAIPWQGNHYNVSLPNVALNTHRLPEDWRLELSKFEDIQALYILTDVTDLDFISSFKNLKELYIVGNTCKEWSFLEVLMELDTLLVRKATYFDTKPIRTLMDKQVQRLEQYRSAIRNNGTYLPIPRVLDEIALTYCNLNDANLLDLGASKSITELDLSHNNLTSIDNLRDVSVYYLTLRYNELTNIESLQYVPYYLNIRHNNVCRLPDFSKVKRSELSRLFVGYNPLPETEIAKTKKLRLLKSDLC